LWQPARGWTFSLSWGTEVGVLVRGPNRLSSVGPEFTCASPGILSYLPLPFHHPTLLTYLFYSLFFCVSHHPPLFCRPLQHLSTFLFCFFFLFLFFFPPGAIPQKHVRLGCCGDLGWWQPPTLHPHSSALAHGIIFPRTSRNSSLVCFWAIDCPTRQLCVYMRRP